MKYIYTLEDFDQNIRYVGQTKNLNSRLYAHCSLNKLKKNNHKNNWIKSLLSKNQKPILKVIEIVTDEDANFYEIYWIEQLLAWGFNLTNGTKGGNFDNANRKGCKLSNEHKAKISKATKGKKKSDEFKRKITGKNNHFFGKTHTEQNKKKMSITAKNNMNEERKKIISASTKKAMADPILKTHVKEQLSKAFSGEKNPMYGKIGKNNPNYGRKNSKSSKEKMRLAALKRWSKKTPK